MTTDVQEIKRAYEVLAFSGHVDIRRKAAFDNAITALEEVERYKQAIEKIKAEINKVLSRSAVVQTVHLPEGKDVNDLSRDEFIECYRQAHLKGVNI